MDIFIQLDAFISFLKNEMAYSKHTIEAYSTDLVLFFNDCKIKETSEFSSENILNYMANHFSDFSPSTLARKASVFRKFSYFLVEITKHFETRQDIRDELKMPSLK